MVGRILHGLIQTPRMTISTLLIGNNITHYVVVALCTTQLRRAGLSGADFWSTIILSPVLLVFAEILPKVVFERRSDKLMRTAAPVIQLCKWMFYPVLLLVRGMLDGLYYLIGREGREGDAFTTDKFKFFLKKSTAGGVITPYQHRMASNIMRLQSIEVVQCLVPLDEVVMVPADAGITDLKDILKQNRYSRLPVYSDDHEQIIGIVNVIDLLRAENMANVKSLSRAPVRIDRSTPIVEALYTLQRAKQQMAVITGEEDNPLGIVTVKDLVERIVGELEAW